ncbi:MAG: hypothetical protein ABI147_13545 [Acidobacteriaceae bacterium]
MADIKELTTATSFSTEEELETLLLDSLNSGGPIEMTPEFWSGLHAELPERRAATQGIRMIEWR